MLIRLLGYMPNPTNEEASVAHLIQLYESELRHFIQSRIGGAEDAKDLLQEVWFQLSKTHKKTKIKTPRAWLYRVTRNKIIDHYRRQAPETWGDLLFDDQAAEEWLEDFESDEDPELMLQQNQFWEALYEALDGLPEKQREVYVLNELQGLTLQQIADQTGNGLKTIISRKTYAIRTLRERLVWLLEEFEIWGI
ncbi:MAG: RNA polymerase sigma factor [Bacteroidota bacterium]